MQQAGRRNLRFTSAKSPRKLRKGTRDALFSFPILYHHIYLFLPAPFFFFLLLIAELFSSSSPSFHPVVKLIFFKEILRD